MKHCKFRCIELSNVKWGKIYLHSMPGINEFLSDFLIAIQQAGVDCIVSLVSLAEIAQRSPSYHALIKARKLPVKRIAFPIKDFDIPSDIEKFIRFISKLRKLITEGKNILIHCAAGIGRTGLCSVCLLCSLGYELETAMELVKNKGSNAESIEQRKFIDKFLQKWN